MDVVGVGADASDFLSPAFHNDPNNATFVNQLQVALDWLESQSPHADQVLTTAAAMANAGFGAYLRVEQTNGGIDSMGLEVTGRYANGAFFQESLVGIRRLHLW